jgi:hypothetical protein
VDPDKTEQDAINEAAAQLALGGPIGFVYSFISAVNSDDAERAAACLAEDGALKDSELATIDLRFLEEPGWAFSGRPRVVSLDTEVVLLVNPGTGKLTTITDTQEYPFVVRRQKEGWRIVNIGVFPD